MRLYQVGDRVGAICSADSETVKFFGYGTYQGDHIPPDDVMGPFGHMALYGAKNPKIQLDDGSVAWGCECWWGSEDQIRKSIGDREVIIVMPDGRRLPTDAERDEAVELMAEATASVEEVLNGIDFAKLDREAEE